MEKHHNEAIPAASPGCHCEEQSDEAISSASPWRHCEEHRDEAIPSVSPRCHCEEQCDEAIPRAPPCVIARSIATKQSPAVQQASLRGALRRSNLLRALVRLLHYVRNDSWMFVRLLHYVRNDTLVAVRLLHCVRNGIRVAVRLLHCVRNDTCPAVRFQMIPGQGLEPVYRPFLMAFGHLRISASASASRLSFWRQNAEER